MNKPISSLEKVKKIARIFASPSTVFWTLPWLMVLLFLGTIAQKHMGIYDVTKIYFSSFIYWIGPIPTPGGLTTIGVLFIALSIKFFAYSKWSWNRAGTILTHLGVLVLLLGGLMTAMTSKEGFMIIPEGDSKNTFSDYYQRELVVKKDGEIITQFSFNELSEAQSFTSDNLEISILLKCENCGAQAPSGTYENLKDLAQNMELTKLPSLREKEANLSGFILGIKNPDNAGQSGTYIVMEDIPRSPKLTTKTNEQIEVLLLRKTTDLPFSITLNDFRKIDYPGTQKAQGYESDITVQDGLATWPVTVSMNKPYRYRGYTFFQSSFDTIEGRELTVFTVVDNKGRLFPYIATAIMLAGLLLHLIIQIQNRRAS